MHDLETEQLALKLGCARDIADPERNVVDTASLDHELPPAVKFWASSIHYHSEAAKGKAPASAPSDRELP